MSKTTREIEIPAKKTTVVDQVWCDICKKPNDHENNWSQGGSDCKRVIVRSTNAEQSQGRIYQTKTEFHICPDCFSDKLIPLLADLGANPTVEYSFD